MGKKQWEGQELHPALLGYLPSAFLASQGLLCLGIIDNGMRMPASLCAQCKAVLVIKLSLRSVQPDAAPGNFQTMQSGSDGPSVKRLTCANRFRGLASIASNLSLKRGRS